MDARSVSLEVNSCNRKNLSLV